MSANAPENSSKSAPPSSSSGAPAAKAKKPRSPVERAVVWGGILVMAALVGYQYYEFRAFRQSADSLWAALKESDTDADKQDAVRLYEKTVKTMLTGNPKLTESKTFDNDPKLSKTDKYAWAGPFKAYTLELQFGKAGTTERDAPEVLNLIENDQPSTDFNKKKK